MAKNIVLCLDGTGNQLKASANTNVVELYRLLDLTDATRQVAFYDPGVGTLGAKGAWTPIGRRTSRVAGLAVGRGLRDNIAEAYIYLMATWEPGDRLFLFGFSRGAYTARALAGLLHSAGLLRPGSENLVQYAISVYARHRQKWSQDDWEQLRRFAEVFSQRVDGSRSVPIEFLGIWDSVKAAGVLRWDSKWPYTRQLPNVMAVRHAVSVDEKRRPYREYLVEAKPPGRAVDEVWFAGVHSDVGGTFEDDSRLSRIAFRWMVQGAGSAGVRLRPDSSCRISVDEEDALGTIHRAGRAWAVLSYRRRKIPVGASVHASVQRRLSVDPTYSRRLPAGFKWSDCDWLVDDSEDKDSTPSPDGAHVTPQSEPQAAPHG